MKKVFRISLIVILIGSGIFVFIYLAGKNKKAPVIYETQSPFVTNIIKKTVATGSIVPRKEIEIKSQVPGIIEEIYVESGQMVKQGDLVAKVRVIPEMRELNSAEARLKQAKIGSKMQKSIRSQKNCLMTG